jgi:hypothetical protein
VILRDFLRSLVGIYPEHPLVGAAAEAIESHLETDEEEKAEFRKDLDDVDRRLTAVEIQLGISSRGGFDAHPSVSEHSSGGVDERLLPPTDSSKPYGSGCVG